VDDVRTMEEIAAAYPSEWVLLDDLRKNEHLQILAGRVVFHAKDRQEVFRKVAEVRPKNFAVRYTGPIPAPNVVCVL
jgi:hypothetical protein